MASGLTPPSSAGASSESISVNILPGDPVASRLGTQPQGDAALYPPVSGGKAGQDAFESFRYLSPSPSPSPGPGLLSGRASPVPLTSFHSEHGSELQQQQAFRPRASGLRLFWQQNKPAILVAMSQFFGALMNLSARLVELDGSGIHPMQVLLVRQGVTAVWCFLYMGWKQTPGFPAGPQGIRKLLLLRGFSGFFGIYGMWYSMMYLPLADATVITFLAPGVAGFICYFVLSEPFTRMEQLATLLALVGVVLIAQPAAFFSHGSPGGGGGRDSTHDSAESDQGSLPGFEHVATPEERLLAIGVALLGVCGAAGAFTCLRTIGKRAHPLISVNYFAMTCIVICGTVLLVAPMLEYNQPALSWKTPASPRQWCLILASGVFGFIMQYLLTAGLSADKSNKANSMVYTHMLFAAAFDKWVFRHDMGLMSFAGCTLILGSAIGVVLMKRTVSLKMNDVERQSNLWEDSEQSSMLVSAGGNVGEAQPDRAR